MNNSNNTTSSTTSSNRRTAKFNFVDLALIVVAALLIGALIYVFSPISTIKNWVNRETKNIRYIVEFTNVDEAFIDKIKDGDMVVDSVSKSALGSVTGEVDYNTKYSVLQAKKVEPTEEEGGVPSDPEYKGVLVEYPDKYNVRVTVSASAKYFEGTGYTVDSKRIAVGEKMYLKFPNFIGEGYCIDVTEY